MAGKARWCCSRQRRVLERLVRTRKLAVRLAERCRIVLGSADALTNLEQADELRVDRQREKFIAYCNAVLAKPFRWTHTGRALQA